VMSELFEIISVCRGGGYRYCRTDPPYPKRNSAGLYPLHRVLMENKLGRILDGDEVVHHKDENKSNDSIDNLELLLRADHARHHRPPAPLSIVHCSQCGDEIKLKPHQLRQRTGRTTKMCCSRSCSVKLQKRKHQ
jgi:hypothetical protein